MEKLKPDATGIYVAAHQAPAAIEEAIEAEVPLIVAVAEHIPIHDILRVRPLTFIGVQRAECFLDTLNVANTIQVPSRWREFSRYHIGDRQMQNWIPAPALFHARSYWYCC